MGSLPRRKEIVMKTPKIPKNEQQVGDVLIEWGETAYQHPMPIGCDYAVFDEEGRVLFAMRGPTWPIRVEIMDYNPGYVERNKEMNEERD